jgi:hypothetical protein
LRRPIGLRGADATGLHDGALAVDGVNVLRVVAARDAADPAARDRPTAYGGSKKQTRRNDRSLASWPDLDEFILGECSVTHSELRGQLPVDLSSLHGRANQVAELCVFLIHAGICPALRGLSGAYGSTAPPR